MRIVYRVFALIICAAVAFQAAVIVWGFAGLGVWVENGGVLDKATMESQGPPPFPEVQGLALHGQNGMMIIPIIVLLFLIVSFFARVPHGRTLALVVVGLTALQIVLGLGLHSTPAVGLLHGINALLLFTTALMAFLVARHGLAPRHRGDPETTEDRKVGVEV